jgi:hypothetical protein
MHHNYSWGLCSHRGGSGSTTAYNVVSDIFFETSDMYLCADHLRVKRLNNSYPCTDHSSRKDPCGEVGMSGRMQGIAGYRGDYWTAIGTSDKLFYYARTKKVGRFE